MIRIYRTTSLPTHMIRIYRTASLPTHMIRMYRTASLPTHMIRIYRTASLPNHMIRIYRTTNRLCWENFKFLNPSKNRNTEKQIIHMGTKKSICIPFYFYNTSTPKSFSIVDINLSWTINKYLWYLTV
jgi:hypothetical protein